jgi:hypothetical protein
LLLSRAIAHVESANFPVAYCGLKIITSLCSVSLIFSERLLPFPQKQVVGKNRLATTKGMIEKAIKTFKHLIYTVLFKLFPEI